MNSDSRHPIPSFKASPVLNPSRFDFDTDTDPDFDLDDVDPLTLFSAWALLPPIEIGIGIGIEIDIRTSINQWSFLDAVFSSTQSTKQSGHPIQFDFPLSALSFIQGFPDDQDILDRRTFEY